MSLHQRRRSRVLGRLRRATSQWRTIVWLTAVWVMLWGDLSVANVLAGALLALTVMTLVPLPSIATHGTVRPWFLAVLVGRFVADLVIASAQVAAMALRPRYRPRGAIVGVQMRNPSDVFMTITAELTSLVPGSIVVEAHRLTGMLYLHVLHLDTPDGAEKVRRETLDLEARVLRAFATNDDLRAAGLYGPAAEPAEEVGR